MIFRILSGAMALVFMLCVAAQYNDPDPLAWMSIYGAAALIAAWAAWRPAPRVANLGLVVGIVALAWAGSIAPRVIGRVPLADLFAEVQMKTPVIEESREMSGLLIVAAWMLVVAFAARRARLRRDPQRADPSLK